MIQRYSIQNDFGSGGGTTPQKDDSGKWVKWEDVEKLLIKLNVIKQPNKCQICGNLFEAKHGSQKTCEDCQHKYNNFKMQRYRQNVKEGTVKRRVSLSHDITR
ncbi:MAG: hypothetical protein WC365_00440 [Candidatus Babeliales bacterium]|jgi:tRNA(Ile2) C34 agmatinyltransferase TiaS